jgi:hypothetical protein
LNEVQWPDQLTLEADRVIGVWYSPAPSDERLIYARDVGGRGIPVEFPVFDDEGHGLAKLKNKLVACPAVVDFSDKHLRGESVPAGARDDS